MEDMQGAEQYRVQGGMDEMTPQTHQHNGVVTSHLNRLAGLQHSQYGSGSENPSHQPMGLAEDGTDSYAAWMMMPAKSEPSETSAVAGTGGSTVTLTDSDVLFMWHSVRERRQLATDADIARLLLSL